MWISQSCLQQREGRASSQDWDSWILLLQVQQIENPRHLIPDFPHLGTMLCLICNCQGLPSTVYGSRTHGVHGGNGQVCKEDSRGRAGSYTIRTFAKRWQPSQALCGKERIQKFFLQCFLGMAKESAEAWCMYCHSVDHTSDLCGDAPRKALVCSSLHLPALRRYAKISTLQKAAHSSCASIGTSARYVKAPMPRSIVTTVAVEKTPKITQSQFQQSSNGSGASKQPYSN